jgi:deoxyribonuclease V
MALELAVTHDWNVSPSEAIDIQKNLADRIEQTPLERPIETVAGLDVSVREEFVQAAVAVVHLEDKQVVDRAVHTGPIAFPYVPGLLSFREIPAILPALDELSVWPDVFMTDSHGLAHPRRFGLACHLGVLLDHPTFGVAKSRLVGSYDEPAVEQGSYTPLREEDRGGTIGAVVRTRTTVNPVFVSIGHRLTLEEAIELTLQCTTRYKIPAPTRQAHLLSRE